MKINLRTILFLASVPLIVSNPSALAHTDITAEQARDLIDSTNNLVVVDVREPSEYCGAIGHIPGAPNYPWNSGVLEARYEELPTNGPVLVVCQSGGRSNRAANFLDSKGFSMVYDMLGGMRAWQWETAPCKYGGGSGTATDPYQIATAADLIALGETTDDYDKHFILTADIDLDPNLPSRKVFDKAVIAPDTNDVNWEFDGTPFTGIFDGNGHTVSNLTIKGKGYLGLLGELGSGAKIFNLGTEAVDVNGTGDYVGGIVGYNEDGRITLSYSTGTVRSEENVGGLVGYNRGSIATSYSTCMVTGSGGVGGLVGNNWYGSIAASYSTGTVSGDGSIGGLVGRNYRGSATTSFWDMETSGLLGSDGGVGLTTDEMMDPETIGLNGLANDPNWVLDSEKDYPRLAWEGTAGELIPQPLIDWMDGNGTPDMPYQITNVDQLIRLSKAGALADKHFILINDLDMEGLSWSQAVIPCLSGSFNGNGFSIRHVSVQGGSHLGLIGTLRAGAVTNLGLANISIEGTGDYVGGLVGSNDDGRVDNCYSTGTVSGDHYVGGLVGVNFGSIATSYSTGTVSGMHYYIGGLVGSNFGSIISSYSTDTVTGDESVGGLVGDNRFGSTTTSFWNMETSGQTTSAGGTGLTTAEMQDINTYLNAGWDFVDENLNGTCEYWQISPGEYPRLRYPGMPEGLGTAQEPYLVRDALDLGTVWFEPMACYHLETSLDLSGTAWSMAVVPWFGGTFDGNGYVISNLHIQGGEYLGLFGQLGSEAKISNLGLEAVDVNGTGHDVGGLVGSNLGNVTHCYSSGLVSGGGWSVGGLAGYNDGSVTMSYSTGTVNGENETVGGLVGENYSSIATCYSTAAVSGTGGVGGLVGQNSWRSSINTSYSTGTINGDSGVGGLAGYNSGRITTSYSTGTVSGNDTVGGLAGYSRYGSIIASFWDMETSGWLTSGGGVGKTTAQMQAAATFLEVSWDFVDETENGTDDIWWILEGRDYPRLAWELTE